MPALAFAATARLHRLLSLRSSITGSFVLVTVRFAAGAACRLALGRPGGKAAKVWGKVGAGGMKCPAAGTALAGTPRKLRTA
jgi:hypothetical protein